MKKAPGEGVVAYVLIKDIDAALKKAVKLGAKVVTPVTEIGGGWSHWAQFKDPGGCTGIALWSRKWARVSAALRPSSGYRTGGLIPAR